MAGKTWLLGILSWTLFLSLLPTPAQTKAPSSPWIRPGKTKVQGPELFPWDPAGEGQAPPARVPGHLQTGPCGVP